MIKEEKKLKRGLKDISPLFFEKGMPFSKAAPVVPVENDPSCTSILSVFSPDIVGDSLFLNSYVASHLASSARPCTVLSLESGYHASPVSQLAPASLSNLTMTAMGPYLRRAVLPWSDFIDICERPQKRIFGEPFARQMLFLDFEWQQVPHFEKIIPILQKWIILSQPNTDSLSQAYKMMKAAAQLNRHMRYFLLFEGEPMAGRGNFLFERFSQIVAKHLQIDLVWLGYLSLTSEKDERFWIHNLLERLQGHESDKIDNPGKIALARFLQSLYLPLVEKAS